MDDLRERTPLTIPYTPRWPAIHDALESRRFVVLVAHRRFGKTVLVINHLLKRALLCGRERGVFAYVGPLRNQAKVVAWDYLKHYSAVIPGRVVNESELCVTVPSNGGVSRIRIFGADNPDALRGLYFDGVVLDEVAQMKPDVWEEVVQPALADRGGWAVFIGTPKGVNLFSELYERASRFQAEGRKDWAAMRFPVTETNALPAEEVERLRAEQSDTVFRQEMLCDFTASADDTLITLDEVTAAMNRPGGLAGAGGAGAGARGLPLIMGVDVARFGSDASAVFCRRGLQAMPPEAFRGLDNMDLADRVAERIAELRPDAVFIDAGQGQGVIDRLRHMGHRVVEVPFGGKALKDTRFANRRAEMWYAVREWLRAGGSLARDEALLAELTAPRYGFDEAGRIRLEPKDDIRERLRRSTDLADALALTFAAPVGVPGLPPKRARSGYDPLAW